MHACSDGFAQCMTMAVVLLFFLILQAYFIKALEGAR
jgi:hypothetical protein